MVEVAVAAFCSRAAGRDHSWGHRESGRSLLILVWLLAAHAVTLASPAGDLSVWLKAQDASLGSGQGTIVIDQPGRIEAPVTLGPLHSLALHAPVDWSATVRLAGGNTVQCSNNAVITAHLPAYGFAQPTGMLLLAAGGSHIRIAGCHVASATPSLLLAGYPISDLDMTGNVLDGVMLLAVNGGPNSSQRLAITKNVVTAAANSHAKYAGMQLNSAQTVTVSTNSFTNLMHGAMWWGGDAGAPGANLSQVTTTGAMTFSGNVCKNVGGSCIWGSMGYDIAMRGNSADGCGDVCFDTEGGLRTQIVNNTASGCVNGCAGLFFFTRQTLIAGNHFYAQAPGGGLIFIKNSSQIPSAHDGLSIAKNDLRCEPQLCRAVYQEAAGSIAFTDNEVTNGVWLPIAYARAVTITRNHFVYTKALTDTPAGLWAPGVLGGTALEVVGNRIESNAAQAVGSACLAAGWSDFNATDTHLIAGNACAGTSPFPIGLIVTSGNGNPGVSSIWIVSANQFGSAKVSNTAKTPNERFFDLGECGPAGCQPDEAAINAVRSLPGCPDKAPAATAGTMPVCLGPVRGWGSVPLSQ